MAHTKKCIKKTKSDLDRKITAWYNSSGSHNKKRDKKNRNYRYN